MTLSLTMTDAERDGAPLDQNSLISIQCDWNSGLKNIGEDVWVTWKSEGNLTLYGTLKRINDSQDIHGIGTTNGFKVVHIAENMIQIGHCMSSRSTIFLAAMQCVSSLHEKKCVNSVAVNSEGKVVSAISNKMVVWDCKTEETQVHFYFVQPIDYAHRLAWVQAAGFAPMHGQERFKKSNNRSRVLVSLNGHVGDIYKCKFFPSGKVVISCGSDMQIKIWCPITAFCPVTLTGHTLAVTDIDFVERGKNLVSVSKDGSIKLWNCGDSSCIAKVGEAHSTINCCQVIQAPPGMELNEPQNYLSAKEELTENKVVLYGCEDGLVGCISLKSRNELFTQRFSSAVNCLAYISNDRYVVGCQNGNIALCSLLSPNVIPLKIWSESQSAVLSIIAHKGIGFLASRADGTVMFTYINNLTVKISLTGSNFDPVYSLASDGQNFYTSCRDGSVRKYMAGKIIENISHVIQ